VLAGEEDILIPVVLSRELGEAVLGSVWRTTRGGHGCLVSWLMSSLEQSKDLESLTTSQWEFPDEFNRTVLDFLETVSEEVAM
jgi:3-oxoadipate enol-lactonase